MSIAHILIELLNRHILVLEITVDMVETELKAHATNAPVSKDLGGNVTGGVGKDNIITHVRVLL
jgi:hypothetical protein